MPLDGDRNRARARSQIHQTRKIVLQSELDKQLYAGKLRRHLEAITNGLSAPVLRRLRRR